MRRTTLACASLLLLAGLTAGCGDDSKDDAKEKETTSASPSDDDGDDSDDESQSPAPGVDPENAEFCAAAEAANAADEVSELQDAVADLVDELPDDAGAAVTRGLKFLQTSLAGSKTGDEFTAKLQAASKDDQTAVRAYSAFEKMTCPSPQAQAPSATMSPSMSPSQSPTP